MYVNANQRRCTIFEGPLSLCNHACDIVNQIYHSPLIHDFEELIDQLELVLDEKWIISQLVHQKLRHLYLVQ